MTRTRTTSEIERQRIKDSFFIPLLLVSILWLVKLTELAFNLPLHEFGVLPRTISGLKGILFYPLIHGDARPTGSYSILGNFAHLFSNTVPLLVMGFIIFHSYRKAFWGLLGMIYILSGIGIWLISSSTSYHIGASGVVYGFAFFIFFSGLLRNDIRAIALALLVAFLYGSIVWGLLPIQEGVSWEGHLAGAIAGTLGAYYYRNVNVPKPFYYDWEFEESENPQAVVGDPFWKPQEKETPKFFQPNDKWDITYHIVPKKKEEEK